MEVGDNPKLRGMPLKVKAIRDLLVKRDDPKPKRRNAFAVIGFGLAVVSAIFIYQLWLLIIPALVLSILGLKSERQLWALLGLAFSIAAIVVLVSVIAGSWD